MSTDPAPIVVVDFDLPTGLSAADRRAHIEDRVTAALRDGLSSAPAALADEQCIYCGRMETEAESQVRDRAHVVVDLLAVHARYEAERPGDSQGFASDVYDLLCDLAAADHAAIVADAEKAASGWIGRPSPAGAHGFAASLARR